ncbi:MAG: SRPBCC domain-containing protein [Novosphingobium sp.]
MAGSAVIVSLRVRASPERAFAGFTQQIGDWWQTNSLFRITSSKSERLELEPGPGGKLVAHMADGRSFTVGSISVWEPGARLVLGWRHESFSEDQVTELEVRFEPVGDETRITVEHRGWDAIPVEHVARHGFPLMLLQRRQAEYWQSLLARLATALG